MYVSQSARNGILSWLPEASAVPSAVISNFVSSVRSEPGQELLGDLVTTGSLLCAKNHRFLLEVLAEARRTGRRLTLDVFGEGPLRQDLLSQARSLGLEEQVRFRGFRPDIRDFLPRYRAYVHASYPDSQSLAIIEAMAAGLPVVAADVGGIAELCDDGVEGRFWPLDDPAQAAAILLDLLDNEPARLQAATLQASDFTGASMPTSSAPSCGPSCWGNLSGPAGFSAVLTTPGTSMTGGAATTAPYGQDCGLMNGCTESMRGPDVLVRL